MICRSKFGLTSTIMDDHPVLSKLFYKILPREQWKSPKLIELFVSTNIKGKFVYCNVNDNGRSSGFVKAVLQNLAKRTVETGKAY